MNSSAPGPRLTPGSRLGAVLVGILLTVCAGSANLVAAQDDANLDARITSIEGSVTLYSSDAPDGEPAEEGVPVEAGDKIVTGAAGRCELGLDGESIVDLGANTQFTVTSLQRESAGFDLGLGSLVAKIKHGLFGSGELDVRTDSAVAAVRGTEFSVEKGPSGESHVGVFDEGQVAVRGAAGGEVQLSPNQETAVWKGRPPIPARKLQWLAARRRRLVRIRGRILVLRRRWARLPPARRRELRQKFFERRKALRRPKRKLREPIKDRRRERRDR